MEFHAVTSPGSCVRVSTESLTSGQLRFAYGFGPDRCEKSQGRKYFVSCGATSQVMTTTTAIVRTMVRGSNDQDFNRSPDSRNNM
jgi:hypothetical protein